MRHLSKSWKCWNCKILIDFFFHKILMLQKVRFLFNVYWIQFYTELCKYAALCWWRKTNSERKGVLLFVLFVFLHKYKLNNLFFIYRFIFLFFKRFNGEWQTNIPREFFLLYREQSKFAFHKGYTFSVYIEIGTLNQSP